MKDLKSEALFVVVQKLLIKFLPKKVKIVKPSLYRDFSEFISDFVKRGGIIEASPSILQKNMGSPGFSFLIEPDGTLEFLSSFEKVLSSLFNPCGFQIPQHSVPNVNVSFSINNR